MNALRFDAIAKAFADRRLSRRAAAGVAAALAATVLDRDSGAQEATPSGPAGTPSAGTGEKIFYLFLQAFRSGGIVPKEGDDGRFTLTLKQGLGQTVYFSDRPLRDVGATPTAGFLERLGFPDDNPPNAALVVDDGAGGTNIAVVELFDPRYDEATRTATYDVVPLADYATSAGGGFAEAPVDLSAVPSDFGAAHLFIDDCADQVVNCFNDAGYGSLVATFGTQGFCWNYLRCVPCQPYYHTNPYDGAAWDWWTHECNLRFADCRGQCSALTSQPF